LLYEKIIASISNKNIWIVDSSKLVKTLGKFPLPIEVVKFGCTNLCIKLETNGFKPTIRMKGNTRYITEENNYIIDLKMDNISNPAVLDAKLKNFAGVVETGLFYSIADTVIAGVGNKIKKGQFKANKVVNHLHEGSIGNLCLKEIKEKMMKAL